MLTETQIKELNDKFKSLSRAEQRVLIAKDVLVQIRAKKYRPNAGSYVNFGKYFPGDESIQKHIDEVTCNCCALGACLLSTTKYKNKLDFSDTYRLDATNDSWGLLKDIFSPRQLTMIEYAFEVSSVGTRVGENYYGTHIDSELEDKCIAFGKVNYDSDKKRLIAIMKNIIKNKGTFKP